MTSAERQRKYREKLKRENPDKLDDLKRKNTARTREKYKKVSEFSEEEQIKLREKWRKVKNKAQKTQEISEENENKNTHEIYDTKTNNEKRKIRAGLSTENLKLKTVITEMSIKINSLNKTIYRYKKKINKLMYIIDKQQEKENAQDKKTEQIIEEKNESDPENNIVNENMEYTPFSKTQKFIEDNLPSIPISEKQKVKKAIFEGYVLKESLLQQYKKAKTNSERDVLKKFVRNEVTAKYKLKTKFSTCLGLQGRIRKKWTSRGQKLRRRKEIEDFLLREDNSRSTAGKKEVKTLNKKQVQIRYLLDSLNNLHRKYQGEGGKLSYVTFTRYKPF